MTTPTTEEIQQILAAAHKSDRRPTKKFFMLEDDIHSAEGLAYLGNEADTVLDLLARLEGTSDWTYVICSTDTLHPVAWGTVLLEAWPDC